MRTHQAKLVANETKKLTVNGSFFILLAAQDVLDLDFEYVGQTGGIEVSKGIEAGYSELFPAQLTAVNVTSAVDQVIKYGYAQGQVNFDRVVSEFNIHQSSVINNFNPVTVGASQVVAVNAGLTRRKLIFTADVANTGVIYLGGDGVTTSNSAIYLEAGDSFEDVQAAAAKYYAIASAAGQVLRISGA